MRSTCRVDPPDVDGACKCLAQTVPYGRNISIHLRRQIVARARGKDILRNPTLNKGTGFTAAERDELGLRGLLPYNRCSQEVQMERILGHLHRKEADIERYIALNALLDDPLYMGWPHPRVCEEVYDALMEEFIAAVTDRWPRVLIQFEDFATTNALRLLDIWRDRTLSFNDDIQGTAAVTLAGVLAATRVSGTVFTDLRLLFVGAGSAATDIGHLMAAALVEHGLSEEDAFGRLWFVDSKGLVVKNREGELATHKTPFAHKHAAMSLEEAIGDIRPHMLIGATDKPGTFTEAVVRQMAEINERSGIFALSNPTSRAECTAEEAYAWPAWSQKSNWSAVSCIHR